MLKIGELSKLAQVSVKTLRHYDKLGLLKPAWTDRFTGYRYYILEQIPHLNRILALKELGFSLEQIKPLLREDVTLTELRGMLKLKHAELQHKVATEQMRLARIETRLQQIEHEGKPWPYDVVLKEMPAIAVISIRKKIPSYAEIGQLFTELQTYLNKYGITLCATSPSMVLYHDTEYRDQWADVEAAVPIAHNAKVRINETTAIRLQQLPGAETMACVIHQGHYTGLWETYNHLFTWTQANGYRAKGPNREVYLQGPMTGVSPEQYITEIQLPVEKVEAMLITKQEKEEAMEPKIMTKPAFTVVGLKYHGKNEANELPQLWAELNPRIDEIQHQTGYAAYGVCGAMDTEGNFDYVAGFAVTSTEDIPEGMVAWEVPEQRYAVFECTLPTIHKTYEYIHQTWLPQSEYERTNGPDFELYGEYFDPSNPGSPMYIYIPIK
ncbi:MAG: GyrI-like domain-containing protein [Anaerolineae bacterium]|nr:GyrI-like domain-containing protein [Anaerolineae bacterium]